MTARRCALISAFLLALVSCFSEKCALSAQDLTLAQQNEKVPGNPIGSSGQDTSALVPNLLYYVNGDKVTKVEMTEGRVKTSVKLSAGVALGRGPRKYLVVPGSSSQLLIEEARPRFRAAVDGRVAHHMRLYRFEQKGGERRAHIGTVSSTLPGFDFVGGISIRVEKVVEGFYQVQPKKPLKPGEYGILNTIDAGTIEEGGPVATFTVRGSSEAK
jgi:hypothetical protein